MFAHPVPEDAIPNLALIPPPKDEKSPREWAVYWVKEWLERGFPMREAADKAIEQMAAQRLVVRCPFVNETGAEWVAYCFRRAQSDMRTAATYPIAESDEDEDETAPSPPLLRIPTTRRLPAIDAVSDRILDNMMFRIDGRWLSLGDVTKAGATTLAADYAKRERSMGDRRRIFETIRDALGEGETVRQRYTPAAMRALFDTTSVPS